MAEAVKKRSVGSKKVKPMAMPELKSRGRPFPRFLYRFSEKNASNALSSTFHNNKIIGFESCLWVQLPIGTYIMGKNAPLFNFTHLAM